ncbi:MAG: carbonic anhydrase [Deltaproteobacteria bacterium]|jgi:carbonic anhydrase|nr:carbonic anhydrase [Deltaproteobacteria bacterium]
MILERLNLSGAPLVQALLIFAPLFMLCWARPALASGHGPENPNSIESTLKALQDGNARFVASRPTHPRQSREHLADLAAHGQTPMAAVLACSDSRVPIEEIFDMGFGDLFVIRAAGAVPGTDQVGSIEYAVAHLGVPVVLVLSHSGCGAISAAVSGADEPGSLGLLLRKLRPVAKAVEGLDESRRLQTAVELSAVIFREQLPLVSPVLDEAVRSGRLAIVSGVYDIATGQVDLDVAPSPDGAAQPDGQPSGEGHAGTSPAQAGAQEPSPPSQPPGTSGGDAEPLGAGSDPY